MCGMQFKVSFSGFFTFGGLTQAFPCLYNFFLIRLPVWLLKLSNNIVSKTVLVFPHVSISCTDGMITRSNMCKCVCTLMNMCSKEHKFFLCKSLCKNLHKPLC